MAGHAGPGCLATLVLVTAWISFAQAQRPPCTGQACYGVLGRVEENSNSDRSNLLGSLAVVPSPQWEHQIAELQDDMKAGLQSVASAQPAKLEQVGGLQNLVGRTSPTTQTLTSIDDYISKISQDIAADSQALKHDSATVVAPSHVKLTKAGLHVVPGSPAPAPIPALSDAKNGDERQKILDEGEQHTLQEVGKKLDQVKEAGIQARPRNLKEKFKMGSKSVSDDLDAAKEAINSLMDFESNLPNDLTGFQAGGRGPVAAVAKAPSTAPAHLMTTDDHALSEPAQPVSSSLAHSASPSTHVAASPAISTTSAAAPRPSVVKDGFHLNPADFDGPNPVQEKMLRKEQQSALRTGKHTDGSRLELSQEDAQHRHQLEGAKEEERAAVKGLRRREEETRAKFEEHEREQKAEDKEHESHLAHELAEDRLAEKIALRRKEMTNEIERVEAHMQNKASEEWEAVQAARKRATIKESDMLAQRKWAKSKQDEEEEEVRWQKDQQMDKYLLEGQKGGGKDVAQDKQGQEDVRARWEKEELQGIEKMDEARKEALIDLRKRIAFAKREQELQAKREQVVEGEELAAHKKLEHEKVLQERRVKALKTQVTKEEESHLKREEEEEEENERHVQRRVAAIRKVDTERSKAMQAEEKRDQEHGKKVVATAEADAERQAAEKRKMVYEEETFRKQALAAISREDKNAVAKRKAQERLEEKAREHTLAARDAAAARRAHEHEQERELEEERRQQELAAERRASEKEQVRLREAQEASAAEHEEKQLERQRVVREAREKELAKLRQQMRAHARKTAARQLVLNDEQADHELKLAQQHAAAAASELRMRGVPTGKAALSLEQLIAKTAAHGAPKALTVSLVRSLRHQVFAGGKGGSGAGGAGAGVGVGAKLGALGPGVGTVMVAQEKDALRDAALQAAAARKAALAREKVEQFAAAEKAKEAARHKAWEERAHREQVAIAKASLEKLERHAQQLHAEHVKQQRKEALLREASAHSEAKLEALERSRAQLLAGGGAGAQDATLKNQGARMTSLFDAKNEAHELRQKYKAARKAVVVDKGALRLAQRQLDHLKARAEAGDLAPKVAAEEVEAHKKAMAMLRAKESEAESESRKLEHEIFLKGQAVP